MSNFRPLFILYLLLVNGAGLAAADFYPVLEAADQTYQKVHVISVNESSMSIRHSRGLAQVKLKDLSPELQAKYGYDLSQDQQREQELAKQRQQQVVIADNRIARLKKTAVRSQSKPASNPQSLTAAFASFGRNPIIAPEVDLREAFRSHSLSIRNQRSRPSCSIHSIVAALEYQYAEFEGNNVNISEDYLMRATSKSVGRPLKLIDAPAGESDNFVVPRDAGFALEQVFQAIRGYGLAYEKEGGTKASLDDFERLENVSFSPFSIPGRNSDTGIQNIIHVLNTKMPVVVGMAWPAAWRIQKTNILTEQPAERGAGHAVTLVGYRCPDGKLENSKFIFRNSWGPKWGAGGYGFVSYKYLKKNLWTSYVVELH